MAPRPSPPAEQRKHREACFIVLAAVFVHALLLWHLAPTKVDLSHDDGISLLAATGHLGAYHRAVSGLPADAGAREHLVGKWLPASEWQRLWRLEESLPFRRIASDLAHFDIHPPLYFWLLHLQLLLAGDTLWAGILLNGLLGVLLVGAIFGFASYVLRDRRSGATAALVWAVSTGVLMTAYEIRQYVLFALCTVLLLWQVMRFCEARPGLSKSAAALSFLAITAGLLTHYHFVIVLAGAGLYVLFELVPSDRRLLAVALGVCCAATATAVLLHPEFYRSFLRHTQHVPAFSWRSFQMRADLFFGGLKHFIAVRPGSIRTLSLVLLLLWLGWLLISRARDAKHVALEKLRDPRARALVFFTVWLVAVSLVLYLGNYTPRHAVGGRHFAAFYPLFACLCVLLGEAVRGGRAFLLCLLVLMKTASIQYLANRTEYAQQLAGSSGIRALAASDAIVLDQIARGRVPGLLFSAPPTTPVYIQPQQALLAADAAAFERLTPASIYISDLYYGNTRARRDEIARRLWRGAPVYPSGKWNGGTILTPGPPQHTPPLEQANTTP